MLYNTRYFLNDLEWNLVIKNGSIISKTIHINIVTSLDKDYK